MKTWSFQRKAFASALLLMILSVSTVGTITFAQEGTTVPADTTTTQPVENNDDGFPWGLLGLLGLGGLAGLRRQPETRTVETIDASRRR